MADYLAIYLNDHLTGATGGLELARRIAGRDDAYATPVRAIADEIEQDKRTLEDLMRRLGVGRDQVHVLVGWVGEKAARLKLNGHLLKFSPLSRMEELEMLSLGVEGKASLWKALRASGDHRLDVTELDILIERATSQRSRLEDLRLRAAADGLGSGSAAA